MQADFDRQIGIEHVASVFAALLVWLRLCRFAQMPFGKSLAAMLAIVVGRALFKLRAPRHVLRKPKQFPYTTLPLLGDVR